MAIYLGVAWLETPAAARGTEVGLNLGTLKGFLISFHFIVNTLVVAAFCFIGIWASGRSAPIFGRKDPPQAVVDEVMGQLITFGFVPFGLGWPFVIAGFLLFRFFDIVKPFPIRTLEILPGGLGICADDIVAGVYAGLCLAVAYSIYLM